MNPLSQEEIQNCLKVLERLSQDPSQLSHLNQEERILLMKSAGRLSHPHANDLRKIARNSRRLRREKRKQCDREARRSAGIREARQNPVFTAPAQIEAPENQRPHLSDARNCYVCKTLFTEVHFFYDSMCPSCAAHNYQKRFHTASLEGRVALVTGGRVKIGYQTALKLLRAGARTLVSTRFPNDAALRFSREEDFKSWKHRLEIHGLDLRHSPSVEMFAKYLLSTEKRLDFLVNNAAQTVRKPPGFYKHLMDWESKTLQELPEELRPLLESYESCKQRLESQLVIGSEQSVENTVLKTWPGKNPAIGIRASAKLSMIPYNFDEETQATLQEAFPEGQLDADLQQVDLRSINSWRLTLANVSTPEMLEVHLVNAVAPFILSAKLKLLMLRAGKNPGGCHIVQASAMEGKFARWTKTDKHPHTNMAKAALNMLTLTSAPDYAKDCIYMNAVDTGWITDEDPAHLSRAKKDMHDFEPPLDIVDGAARLLDPIFSAVNGDLPVWGKFLKDYKPTEW